MPALVIQILQVYADIVILIFVGYYFLKLWVREKELEKKEHKADTAYHQIVDDALSKERKIVDDATHEAQQILAGAHYINQATKEAVHQALAKMAEDIQKDAVSAASEFMKSYQASLRDLSSQSLTDFREYAKEQDMELKRQIKAFHTTLNESLANFQDVAKGMEGDLQQQIQAFHQTLLPTMQKELEDYKQARMAQTERTVAKIVQKVSQEVLNKSLSNDDQQKLLLESLDKAKKEGMFE